MPFWAWDDRVGYESPAGCRLTLAALPSAPSRARRHARAALRGWGVDPGTIETAELLISELVTNAAGASGQPARAGQADDGSIWLSLRMVCRRLTIEVTDLDPNPPVLLYVGQDAESGRGLMLVDALSADWDYFHPPSGGKTVFCVIELPPAPPGCAGDARHRDHEERKTA